MTKPLHNILAVCLAVTLLCGCVPYATLEISIDIGKNDFNDASGMMIKILNKFNFQPIKGRDSYDVIDVYWEDRPEHLSLRFEMIDNNHEYRGSVDYLDEAKQFRILLDEMLSVHKYSNEGRIIARNFVNELRNEFGANAVVVVKSQ